MCTPPESPEKHDALIPMVDTLSMSIIKMILSQKFCISMRADTLNFRHNKIVYINICSFKSNREVLGSLLENQ